MNTDEIEHPGFREVGRLMRYFVEKYYRDVEYLSGLTAMQLFRLVEQYPYVMDRDTVGLEAEFLARPDVFSQFRGIDCKKKSIWVACWAKCCGYGYRFVAVDDTGYGVSHVFAEVEFRPGYWVSMDCTIPGLFLPGSPMPNVIYAEVI